MRTLLTALVLLALLAAPAAGDDGAARLERGRAAYDASDYDTAIDALVPLARGGNAEAQFLMAMIYGNGFGVPKDRNAAAAWYIRAAEQGHPVAQLHLGFYHRRGYGVPQDRVMSHMWTALSAELGHAEAVEWRDKVALEMSPEEIALAERLAGQWLARWRKLRE